MTFLLSKPKLGLSFDRVLFFLLLLFLHREFFFLFHKDAILSESNVSRISWHIKDLGPELQCLLKVKEDLS